MHIDAGVPGSGDEALESAEDSQLAVAVDGDQPRAHQWCVVPQAAVDGVDRHAKQQGQRSRPEVEGVGSSDVAQEDVVDDRLDNRLRVVSQQKLQDAEVRSGETHRPAQPSEPLCGPVVPDRPHRRVFATQSPFKAPKLARRRRDFSVLIQPAVARPPPVARERTRGLPFGDPGRQLHRLTIAVVKARGGVGEIEGEQASFVGGQHGSLRIGAPERAYRATASDMDVLVEFGDGLPILSRESNRAAAQA